MSEGKKFDQGKPSLSLIPRVALEAEAEVFGFGAKKYGRDNYKAGMDWLRVIDAALRHLNAIADGEDTDPESGFPHAAHVRCCMAMLLYYMNKGVGTDSRYRRDPPPTEGSSSEIPNDKTLATFAKTDRREEIYDAEYTKECIRKLSERYPTWWGVE